MLLDCQPYIEHKRPAIIVIDSVTYLLTISLPDIDKVAMSLYNIMNLEIQPMLAVMF